MHIFKLPEIKNLFLCCVHAPGFLTLIVQSDVCTAFGGLKLEGGFHVYLLKEESPTWGLCQLVWKPSLV